MASGAGFSPQPCQAFPREALPVLSCTWCVWESPCQHQEGIQPCNDLLKRNQLMGSHAMTSTSGSSNIFPLQMQPNHSWIPLSSLTRAQLKASPSTNPSDKAENPQPRALSHLLPAQPEVRTQKRLSFASTEPAKHPWCLPEPLTSLRGIHHLPHQHQPGIFSPLL